MRMVGPSAVAFILALSPGLAVPSLLVAAPLVVAAGILWLKGRETARKRLDEIR